MRVLRPLLALLVPVLLLPALAAGPAPAAPVPTLVAITAAHHPGFDRVVFRFRGGVPATHRARYVDQLLGDASGLPVRIAGQAVLQVTFRAAQAHDAQGPTAPARKAFALPNVMTTVRSGDFEAVTTYGIGLAKKTSRAGVDAAEPRARRRGHRAAFRTVDRRVFFVDSGRVAAEPRPVRRGQEPAGASDLPGAGPDGPAVRGAATRASGPRGSCSCARTRRAMPG